MAVLARTLSVRSYRNYRAYVLELSPTVTILHGKNAVGKTNLIEALQLLTSAASFRKPASQELVRLGDAVAALKLELEGDGRRLDFSLDVAEGKRSFKKNGKRCKAADIRGNLPSVLFCPDDLDMVKRSAKFRRNALDTFGTQLSRQYAQLLGEYEKSVEQRNSLLKAPSVDAYLLEAWNEHLVRTGAALLLHRVSLLQRLAPYIQQAYASIAQSEDASVEYQSSLGGLYGKDLQEASREEIEHLFLGCLEERSEEERRRGVTLVGPHRDELLFSIGGKDARSFASQGQQRSLVLAWKIAEVNVAHDVLHTYPLLLLDDVMSELDAERREAFLQFVEGKIQTVVTTTNLGYFSQEILDMSKLVEIDGRN